MEERYPLTGTARARLTGLMGPAAVTGRSTLSSLSSAPLSSSLLSYSPLYSSHESAPSGAATPSSRAASAVDVFEDVSSDQWVLTWVDT